jgi:hypothetical protein
MQYMNSKRRTILALAVNPQVALIMAWKLLPGWAEGRRYWREEERRARLGRVGAQ